MNQLEPQCNPWLAILYAPKRVWEVILSRNPYSDYQFWLVFLASILILCLATYLGPLQPRIAAFPLVFSVIFLSILFLLDSLILIIICIVFGALAKWGGNWLGGTGSHKKMQAVLMWAGLPMVYLYGVCIFVMLLGGKPASEVMTFYVFGKTPIYYIMLLWASILVGFGYAEAHELSIKKGLLLSGIAYVIPMLILCVLTP